MSAQKELRNKFNNLYVEESLDSGMEKRRYPGRMLVILGLIVILVKPIANISGLAIAEHLEAVSKVWFWVAGAVLVVAGAILQIRQELPGRLEIETSRQRKILREINNALRSGRMGTYRELEDYARTLGCVLKDKKNHVMVYQQDGKTPLMYKDRPIIIPRHNEKLGTYRGILRGLREGIAAA